MKPYLVPVLLLLSLLPASRAAIGVDDGANGFSFTVPENFAPFPEGKNNRAEVLYSYISTDRTLTQTPVFVNVELLRGTFRPGDRVDSKDMPAGVDASLSEMRWGAHTLDLMRSQMTDARGVKNVGYVVQLPIMPNAVQVVAVSRESREADARQAVVKFAQTFRARETVPTKAEAKANRVGSTIRGASTLLLIVGILFARRMKKKDDALC